MNLIPYLLLTPIIGVTLLVFYTIGLLMFNAKAVRVTIPAATSKHHESEKGQGLIEYAIVIVILAIVVIIILATCLCLRH